MEGSGWGPLGEGALLFLSPDRQRPVWVACGAFWGNGVRVCAGRGWQEGLWRWSVSADGEQSTPAHSLVPENVNVSDWMNVWYGGVLLVLWQELLEEAQNSLF